MRKQFSKLFPADWTVMAYIAITSLLILLFEKDNIQLLSLLSIRILFIIFIFTISSVYTKHPNKWIGFLRHFYPLISLVYFYPEVDLIDNYIFAGFDQLLVKIEFGLFNMQPSLMFFELVPNKIFNEIMFFSYFSFYWFIIIIAFHEFYRNKQNFNRILFIIMFSLLGYYLIFIFFPASGPQYFFSDEYSEIPAFGLFGKIMRMIQQTGERPAGAFPSSHVGAAVVVLLYTYYHAKKLFWYFLPMLLLIFLSTVYIRAHYLIDSLAGLLTGPVFYYSGNYIYNATAGIASQRN